MNEFLNDRIENLASCFRFLKHYEESLGTRTLGNEIDKCIETIEPGYFPTFAAQYHVGTLEILPKHPRLFDLAMMSTALESYYRGVDQFPAGFFLEKRDYTQFALFSHYSSLYHLIDSFLAIHGIVFIPLPKDGVETVPTPKPEGLPERLVHIFPTMRLSLLRKRNGDPIAAVKGTAKMLTKRKSKRWLFEPTNLKHETRWREFGGLLLKCLDAGSSSEISKDLRYFIEYFGNHILIGSPEWGSYDAVGNNAHLRILIPKACKNIPKIRHEAIYRNEAWDRAAKHAAEFLDYKDLPLDPLKYKIYHLKHLNIALLDWQTNILSTFIGRTKEAVKDDEIFSRGYEKCILLTDLLEMSDRHIIEEEEGLNLVNPRIKDIALEIFNKKIGRIPNN